MAQSNLNFVTLLGSLRKAHSKLMRQPSKEY